MSEAGTTVVGKGCRVCGEEIKPVARKCIHCGSYQDWRGGLGAGTTALSLLVALISVVTTGAPFIKQTLTPDNSRFSFSLQAVDDVGSSFSVFVSNQGNRPGTVSTGVSLGVTDTASGELTSYLFKAKGGIFFGSMTVEPGKSLSIEYQLLRRDLRPTSDTPRSCILNFRYTNFDGSDHNTPLAVDCAKILASLPSALAPR